MCAPNSLYLEFVYRMHDNTVLEICNFSNQSNVLMYNRYFMITILSVSTKENYSIIL